MNKVMVCGNSCGHNHDSLNGPTGCCPQHGPYMYFCNDCHEAWRAKHPKTAEAIARFAAGKGSRAAIDKARRQEQV